MTDQRPHDGHDRSSASLARSAERLKESAGCMRQDTRSMVDSTGAMQKDTRGMADSADRRTELAANRTALAIERTYAAWMRTGLSFLAAGVGVKALLESVLPLWLVKSTGVALIAFAAFCFAAAVWREVRPSFRPPAPEVPRLPPGVLIALSAFLTLAALATLVAVAAG